MALISNLKRGRYRGDGFRTYVYRITKFTCLNFYDKKRATETLQDEIRSHGSDSLEKLISDEEHSSLRKILRQIGWNCRRIIMLRYLRELDYETISSKLAISATTARQRLKRCLDRAIDLRKDIE